MSRIYENVARWSLYLLVLLVPVIYLPWTVDPLEIHKQTLTLVLVSVAVIAWLGLMVSAKQFFLKKSWIFLLAIAFLASALVSSTLSLAPVTSWIGQGTQEYTSFASLLAFVLMFILGAHFLDETKSQRTVWTLAFVASTIVGLFSFFATLGLPILNTLFVGTPNALGIYLSAMSVLGCGLMLVSKTKSSDHILPAGSFGIFVRVLITLTVLSTLFVLVNIDDTLLWLPLLSGLIVLFTFALYRAHEFPNSSHFILPMLLFVVAILLVFLPSPIKNALPLEVGPSGHVSEGVAFKTLQGESVLFGSGPGTFVMDYTKYKEEAINATTLWDARFDRANSQVLTLLATFGVVGTALFFAFIISLLVLTLSMLLRRQPADEWKMTFVTFAAWIVMITSLFVYSSNFTLAFLFWFLSAVLASQIGPAVKHINFSQSPRGALLTTFLFVLVSVGLLTLIFVSVSRYAADIAFAQAMESDERNDSIDITIEKLDTAAQLNRWSDVYFRNLSAALLAKTAQLLDVPEPDTTQLQGYVAMTISTAERAKAISPNYVVNWSMLGDIYREFAPLVGDSELFAIDAYAKAIELAPTNPKYYTAQARAYIIRSEALTKFMTSDDTEAAESATKERSDALANAEMQLLKALQLKPDYAPASYYLALVYERQGNLAEAISRMVTLRDDNPLDVGIHFQLGLLYLKQGKITDAQTSFEKAIEIAPSFSNARWYLSYVYEQNGDFDAAIVQVEEIKKLNPGNTTVEDRLTQLQSGNVVETIPEPLESDADAEITIEDSTTTQ